MLAHQSPWIVHESDGPVAGSVSQNCDCSSRPPGLLKQQVSVTLEVLWQLSWELSSEQDVTSARAPPAKKSCAAAAPSASAAAERDDGIVICFIILS